VVREEGTMIGYLLEELQKYGPLFGFLGTILGLIFAGLQVRKNTQTQRANFLLQLANRDLDKDGGWDLFFKIEIDKFTMPDMREFDDSEEAVALDALLYHFNLIGRMVRMGVISLAEANFFKYEIKTVLGNKQVLDYLKWFEKENKIKELYPDARALAADL
jgi:hypothetical protein